MAQEFAESVEEYFAHVPSRFVVEHVFEICKVFPLLKDEINGTNTDSMRKRMTSAIKNSRYVSEYNSRNVVCGKKRREDCP